VRNVSNISLRRIQHLEYGRVFSLQAKTLLRAPIDKVFEFFSNAENLEKLTPPWIEFRILTSLPIEMRQGTLIDYRISLHGLPVNWKTEISVWDPPRRFVDTQLSGPYRLWRHTHSFSPCPEGTEMEDEVLYWPLGGVLANRLLVERDVRRIFEFRSREIQRLFNGSLDERANREAIGVK